MAMHGPAYSTLLMIYVGTLLFLAFIALLISTFYTRKLNQPSPRIGFVFTLVFTAGFLVSFAFMRDGWLLPVRTAQMYLLLLSSISALAGFLGLYVTMKRIRK